jgi:plastocyanin
VTILALVVILVGAAGWFGGSWREHPTWTPRVRERVRYRLLVPAALPFAMLGLAAAIAIGVSRILLAVSEKAAVGVALALAVALIVAFFVLSSRPRLGRSALTGLVVLAVLAVGGAGIAGAAKGERKIETVQGGPAPVHVTAHNIRFDLTEMTLGPGVPVVFRNRDTGIFHNVAFYTENPDGSQGRALFNGQPIDKGEIVYHPPVPPPGTYLFACDFHANMRGTLTVHG